MPRPIEATTPSPRDRRVTSDQARIERTLTDIFFEVPVSERTARGESRWTLVSCGHTTGYAQCVVCRHTPIRRLFWVAPLITANNGVDTIGPVEMLCYGCAASRAPLMLVDEYAAALRDASRAQTRTSTNPALRVADRPASLLALGLLASETDEPATVSSAVGIRNGLYTLTISGARDTYEYQIYTVQRSESAPDLVGKRVIKAKNDAGMWKAFAYLTKSGHVRMWRRMLPVAHEPQYQYANSLLEVWRDNATSPADTIAIQLPMADNAGRQFIAKRITSTCRYCNYDISNIGPSSLCQTHRVNRTSAERRVTLTPPIGIVAAYGDNITERRSPLYDAGDSRPPQSRQATRALALDELGQGEVL